MTVEQSSTPSFRARVGWFLRAVLIGAVLYVMAGLLFQRVGRDIRSFRVA